MLAILGPAQYLWPLVNLDLNLNATPIVLFPLASMLSMN